MRQGAVIDDAAARQVDQRGRGLHSGQFCRANGVVRGGAVGQYQHHMVRGLQEFLLARITCFAGRFSSGIQAAAVVINHLHAKTKSRAAGNGLPNAPHANDPQSAAMHFGAGEHVIAPACPQPGAQKMLAFGHPPGGSEQKRKAEIGRGFGQHIGCIGAQHTGSGHGGQVKIVIAHRHIGANF